MAKAWRAHVDFACPECGELLVVCDAHFPADRACVACKGPAKLIGIGGARVEGGLQLWDFEIRRDVDAAVERVVALLLADARDST